MVFRVVTWIITVIIGAVRALCENAPLDTGLPQIPAQSKTAANESKQTVFHSENARMLSVLYLNLLFVPRGRMLPRWWVGFGVATGKLPLGAVPALCRIAPSLCIRPTMDGVYAHGLKRKRQ